MNELLVFVKDNFGHTSPLLAAAFVAVAIVFERTVALYMRYPIRNLDHFFERIRDLLLSDRLADAVAYCDLHKGKAVAKIVREGVMRADQPEVIIEDTLHLTVSKCTQAIQKRTQFLATIANVATLLGLLGTIMGLIQSFKAVGGANAAEKSAMLAAGISTAMHATMLGLGIAVPCMLAFAFLMNRTNRLTTELEQAAVQVMTLIRQRIFSVEVGAQGSHDGKRRRAV